LRKTLKKAGVETRDSRFEARTHPTSLAVAGGVRFLHPGFELVWGEFGFRGLPFSPYSFLTEGLLVLKYPIIKNHLDQA
jgi:hypothetical protein